MTRKKTFFLFSLLFVFYVVSYAQQPVSLISTNATTQNEILVDTIKITIDTVKPLSKNKTQAYPPPFKDFRKLRYNTSIYLGATVVTFGVLWIMPEHATNWDKEEMKQNGFFWKWKENVKAGPMMDNDKWPLNYLAHPYCGGIYYMTARSSGFNILESFGYSTLMSTFFWEYGIESFAEIPSTQDLIITPILGSVVGESFFIAKKSIVKHHHKILKSKLLGYTALFFMDPFNTILDGFGYQSKVKTQMNFAPVGVNLFSKAPVLGFNFSAQF